MLKTGLLFAALVLIFLVWVPKAGAHAGNIAVKSAECYSAESVNSTYRVWWNNATPTGKLFTKSGLVNSPSPWVEVKNVSGTSGETTFTLTHPKSSFSGGNGPWVSFQIVFSDNYKINGDTRVEGFDWSKCTPPPHDECEDLPGDQPEGFDCTGPSPEVEKITDELLS